MSSNKDLPCAFCGQPLETKEDVERGSHEECYESYWENIESETG